MDSPLYELHRIHGLLAMNRQTGRKETGSQNDFVDWIMNIGDAYFKEAVSISEAGFFLFL
jgi:hypothetical protein